MLAFGASTGTVAATAVLECVKSICASPCPVVTWGGRGPSVDLGSS